MKMKIKAQKGIILLLVFGMIFVSSCAQQQSQEDIIGKGTPVSQESQAAQIKEFKITARQFAFDPETIEISRGDKVRLIVTSVDVTHGITIPEYGINERLEPGKPVTIEFTANKEGTFTAFCSVYCGSGHSSMKGKIIVR